MAREEYEYQELYKMKLHEILITSVEGFLFTTVMRVPGGWIYRSFDKGNAIVSQSFVPFDNEFMYKLKEGSSETV